MKNDSFVEVIYIGANNKIISYNVKYIQGLNLNDLLDVLVKRSIFSKEFLRSKNFGCYGEIINMSYLIKQHDRIEILDNLKTSPNDKRKHNFYKNQ